MRIAENLEVRISSSGKTFQIVSTSGKRDFVVASIPRDIGDQLFNCDDTYRKLIETFNEVRDQLPTRETLQNAYRSSQQEAKNYRETPSNMQPSVSKVRKRVSNAAQSAPVPAITAMQARAAQAIMNQTEANSEPVKQTVVSDRKARIQALLRELNAVSTLSA